MIGKALEVFGKPIAIDPLDRFGDPCVKLAATLLEKRSVRDVVGEDMLEGVFGVGKQVHLIDEFGGDEVGQAMPQIGLGSLGNFAKKNDWHMGADGGRGLKQALVRSGEAIDPRGEESMDARRNLERRDRLGEAIRAWLADESF